MNRYVQIFVWFFVMFVFLGFCGFMAYGLSIPSLRTYVIEEVGWNMLFLAIVGAASSTIMVCCYGVSHIHNLLHSEEEVKV